MASEHTELEGRLDALLQSTESVRVEIQKENKKRDVRIRTNRIATFAAIAAAVVGIGIGGIGVSTGHDASASARHANAALAHTNAILATSRKASCDSLASQATQTRAGQKRQIRILVTALTKGAPNTPDVRQQIADFELAYDKEVNVDNPVRDCTPRGIACYLKLPPPAGSKPCDGSDGFLNV